MRYRITQAGTEIPAHGNADFVTSGVWITLFVGIVLLVMGVHGRQRWLKFWGGMTCACCGAYFLREWITFPAI